MTLLLLLSCGSSAPWASAYQIESLDQTIGGPKAIARPGDFMLENDRIRIAVIGARASLGPAPFGGTVADIDLQRTDPAYGAGHGNDQFAELFATVNMNIPAADTEGEVTVLADGSDGAAIIRVDAEGAPLLSMLDALWTIVNQPDFRMTTDYILEPGSPALKIVTTASLSTLGTELPTPTPAEGSTTELELLDLAITDGFSFGDFYLQGGSMDVFSPGVGFDEDKAVAEAAEQGINAFQDPFRFDFVAGVGDGVSYAIATPIGNVFVPLFTSSQTAVFGAGVMGDGTDERFPQGASYSYERYLSVGRGDVGSALDGLLEVMDKPYGDVMGYVVEEGTGTPLSDISVLVFQKGAEKPYSQWLSDVGDDTQRDGSFGGHLPPGDYELLVHTQGRPDGTRVPITVSEGKVFNVVLAAPIPGVVRVQLQDESGLSVPAKLSFFREDGTSTLNSDYGDSYIAGGASEVVFAPHGSAEVVLPPGNYHVVATRGLEYELTESETFTVRADGAVDLNLLMVRSVDTSGWVSADFHVHAINSFDSGTTLSERVATMVCEGVEFFSSSDHDYLTDYAPTVEDLGLEPWVKTAVGLETTTLEVGHFIGFPLGLNTLEENGGVFDWTGMTPTQILEEFNTLGQQGGYEPVRMVAHPRDGILGYFDQFGFDPYTGEIATPLLSMVNPILLEANYTTGYEAIELLNGKRFELLRTPTQPELDTYAEGGALSSFDMVARTQDEQDNLIAGTFTLGYGHEGQIDDWFTLLNTGIRLVALGNSDTHGKYSIEAGCPRNYVMASTDEPAYLDEQDIADAVREGRVVASYGPFVRFWANDPENGVGAELVDSDGTVELGVEVQAPTWMTVDRVELYQNGTLIKEFTELAQGDVLRLDTTFSATLDKDSWFVAIVVGSSDLAPMFTPVEFPPIQLQDVVTEALGDVESLSSYLSPAVPIPRVGEVIPFALTNPIYVDTAGDGWSAPGLPTWLVAPPEPE